MSSPTSDDGPMTKVWLVRLISPATVSDASFLALWREVFAFIYSHSGTEKAGHTLWYDAAQPDSVVLISGYPTAATNHAADRAYWASDYFQRINACCKHETLYWINADVNTLLPHESGGDGSLRLEVFEVGDVDGAGDEGVVAPAHEVAGASTFGKEVRLRFATPAGEAASKATRSLKLNRVAL